MRKRITILLTLLILITGMLPAVPVDAEGESESTPNRPSTDIIISEYSTDSSGDIEKDDDFDLELTLKKDSLIEEDQIEDLFITIGQSDSFIPYEQGSKFEVTNTEWDGDELKNVSLHLKYIGGTSTSLSLTITATIAGEPFSNTDFVNIEVDASEEDGKDDMPPDPILHVDNDKMPVAYAGKAFKLKLSINNDNAYSVKDITITPIYAGDGNDPFQYSTIRQSGFIEKISARKSEEITFNYMIAPNTPTGIYNLTLNYSYYTQYKDEPITFSEIIRVKIENDNAAPSLAISKVSYPENGLQTGSTVPVKFTVTNKGSFPAKDVVVTLSGLDTAGFTVEGNGNRATVATLYRGMESQVTFHIRVADGMAAGSHPLTAHMEYKDDAGNPYSQDAQFYLPVTTGDPQAEGLQIQNVSVSDKSYGIDENIPVRFDLVNNGQTKLYSVKVSLTADAVIIPKLASMKMFNVMEPGKSEALEFMFAAKKEAETRNYPIAIDVEYKTKPDADAVKLTQYVGVNVVNKENAAAGNKSVPKIIIDSYGTDPVIVRAGSNFLLNVSFHNTNSTKTVSNIKVNLTAPEETEGGNVFSPVNSSNTFYIDSIAPKSSIEMSRDFYTIPDAKAETYTLIANFEYEYEGLDGAPVTAQEQIGIPVVQQTRLESSAITMPPTSYAGQPIPLSFEFYNMGKVTLSNLMITVEGDFTNQTPNYFVGNFEPGLSDYYDSMITPNKTGQLAGTVVFEYDDAAGEHQEVRKEFTTTVEEMPAEVMNPEGEKMGEMPPDGMPEEPKGIMKIVKSPITWVVVGVIVLGTAALIIRKKIKKRKEMTLDE